MASRASNARRSMGTTQGARPQRVSVSSSAEKDPARQKGAAAAAARQFLHPGQSGSRIPRAGSAAKPKPIAARGRSSSSSNNLITPLKANNQLRSRSSSAQRSSAFKTPQRVLQPQNMNRYSMTGGRKSSIGAKSGGDNRRLAEKLFQDQAANEIHDFLRHSGYDKGLCGAAGAPPDPARAVPVNSTEFKAIFEFLIRFLDADYEVSCLELSSSFRFLMISFCC